MSCFDVEKIENCYAHSQTYAYAFAVALDDRLVDNLSTLGELTINRKFRRPFFLLKLADGAEIRGALGDDRMKASFPDDRVDESKRFFEDALAAILAARETE